MASSTNNNNRNKLFGGLKVRNIHEISHTFICEFCGLVLLHPWQLLCCGLLLCKRCLLNGLSNSEPFLCPHCQVKQLKKEALADRGAERELKTIIVGCYSCTWEGLYSDYLEHLQEQHADLECLECHEHFFAINSFEEHRQELCSERSIPCELPDCMNSIKWYDMKPHYLGNKHQRKLVTIISQHVHSEHRQMQEQNHFREYKDIQKSIGILFSTYETLLNDVIRLEIEISQIKANFEQNALKVEEVKREEKENEKSLKEVTEKLNGTQIILDNIKKTREESDILILDANSTTTLRFNLPTTTSFSMNSSKFKTSQYGYIFMLRVCSTIEPQGEYLSIFLSLFNGAYNNLIPFPYCYEMHFVLWDQSNQQNHIVHVLKPDLTSPAFSRPINEKNDEYGIIKFCLLRYLTDPESVYVKDGVFFIRIFIDFLNTVQNPFQSRNNNQDTEIMATTTTTMITD